MKTLGIILGLSALFAAPAQAQQNQPLFATGPLTPGHALVLQQTGTPGSAVTRDGGPAIAGNFTELGITNDGLPLCVRDKANQHIICLGANVLGGGMISYNPLGGGSPLGLNINLNGVNYPFPGVGSGNVVAPTSPAPGATHVAAWNGGTAISDPALLPPVFTNTQMNEYAASLINGISPATEFRATQSGPPNSSTDAFFGGVAVPNTSSVYQSNGVAGFINTSSTTTNAVGGFFQARSLAANTKIWALNTVAADMGFPVTNAGAEFDTNCTNAGSHCNGITVIGASTAQFTGNGISVSSPSIQSIGAVKWSNGFIVESGAATVALAVGATQSTPAGNIGSQPIDFVYYNGLGVTNIYTVAVNTGQALSITSSAGSHQAVLGVDGVVQLPQAGSLVLGVDQAVASTGSGVLDFASGNTLTAVSIGNGTAELTINVANGGTATNYVCTDSLNRVVIQAGAC